ncbi:hypothetical protein BO82DRAFT_357691 [Aspergillus uvarum CBS 121591]|uniref:Uncharacterized protein n=1 Tax=Aspergillus uvarum CBS 121591 TaxID=1448315 RepID=A0A319C2S4_9EURO|nr:hypothetical protein BO82DRAFT_357691 [Aspergillus uvarum CBS 121591]PYH78099.1 hypothetical protein BO82DRAFT_357691 [Aspergillus uvarum CBS 121591]
MDPAQLSRLGRDLRFQPVPAATDDLKETLKKLQDLAEVATQGNSLALFTGLELVAPPTRDLEKLAKEQMSPREVLLYETWKARKPDPNVEGSLLPSFEWDANVAPVRQGAHSLKKLTKRAAAMGVVFDHQGATPENAAWLTFHIPKTSPRVKAVSRILYCKQSLEQQSRAHSRGLAGMEAAELETIRKIVAVAEVNTNRELVRMRRLARLIKESASILKSRAEALQKSRDPVSALHEEN